MSPDNSNGNLRKKIINGSGVAAILGSLSMTALQYHENSTLKEAMFSTQHALEVMADRYERLVNRCVNE